MAKKKKLIGYCWYLGEIWWSGPKQWSSNYNQLTLSTYYVSETLLKSALPILTHFILVLML